MAPEVPDRSEVHSWSALNSLGLDCCIAQLLEVKEKKLEEALYDGGKDEDEEAGYFVC